MVDAGQRTVTPVHADVVNAPGLGAQVARMVLISWGRMLGAVSIDGQDRRFGQSPMTPVGRSPPGLVLSLMLISFPLRWRATVRRVLCGC